MKFEEITRLRVLAAKGMISTEEVFSLCDALTQLLDDAKTFTIQTTDNATFIAGDFEFRHIAGRPAYLEIDGKKMDKFETVELRADTNDKGSIVVARVKF